MKKEAIQNLSITEKVQSKFLITPENLPYFILPIVDYIHDFQPDCVMALDTGARIIGLAVFKLYGKLYGPFPTIDHKLLFRRVSHKIPQQLVLNQIKADIISLTTRKTFSRLFIVDDWVTTGRTTRMVEKIINEISLGRIDIRFGVTREFFTNIADVHGDRFSIARSEWHHKANLIGITYSPELTPLPIKSLESYRLRRSIMISIENFAAQAKKRSF